MIDFHRGAYFACMLAAVLVFWMLRRLERARQPSQSLSRLDALMLGWAAFVGGAIGGKLPFALYDRSAIWSPEAWLADGKTITTGLIGAYLSVELCKWLLAIPNKTGDGYALPLAGALAIGRFGCFFNGCCFGTPTELPWGVDFGAGAVHPTQIYEVLFHLTFAIVLWVLPEHEWLRHQRLKLYLIAYCVYRFCTEWIRPEPELAWGLTFYQWVVLLFAIGLTVQWRIDAVQRRTARQQATLTPR